MCVCVCSTLQKLFLSFFKFFCQLLEQLRTNYEDFYKKIHFSKETGILLTRIAKSIESPSEENNESPKVKTRYVEIL